MEQQYNLTTEKIISAIEHRRIKPRPVWYFKARNTILWVPGVITTLIGAYTVAGVLYGIIHSHFVENKLYSDSTSQIVSIVAIPIIWIISFGIFSFMTTSLLRRTHKGYRHTARQLLSISVASSIVIGIVFYYFTAGSITGPGLLYEYPTQAREQAIWDNPATGKISGIVTAADKDTIMLTGFNGVPWTITTDDIPAGELYRAQLGSAIRVIGIAGDNGIFIACRILSWEMFPTKPSVVLPILSLHKTSNDCKSVLAHFSQP